MSDANQHQEAISECALAWQTLRMAHDRVAQQLSAELSGALLEAVPLSQPALSRLVARLEARGLLSRSQAEGDARAVVVCLTESGAALIDRALAIHARVVHETLIGKFTETERTALLRTLSQIGQ
jgi:DNA-binding MarR family transcriptional regulator